MDSLENSTTEYAQGEDHEDLTDVAPVTEEAEDEKDRNWYIIQCFSLYEYKVRNRIQQMVEDKVLKGVSRVLIPEEETIEIKNNKRLEKVAKIYPGYVFVEAVMNDDIWYTIRQIGGVSKFVGTKNSPTPVQEDEILRVLRKIGDKTKKIEVDFELAEIIKVIAGPFRGYAGQISELFPERGKLKAMISIFGRETPVELDFNQVEKSIK